MPKLATVRTALAPAQLKAARDLLAIRPPVFDNTRVIINDDKRAAWFAIATNVAAYHRIPSHLSTEFFDLAGVPD